MEMATSQVLIVLGMALIVVGFVVIVLAFLLLAAKSDKGGRISGGGAVIIGPLPIVFGTDRKTLKTVVLLSIVLTLSLLVVMIVSYFLR